MSIFLTSFVNIDNFGQNRDFLQKLRKEGKGEQESGEAKVFV